MIEFFSGHWGDLSSVAGVIVSFIGLTWAVTAARAAQSSAEAAKEASDETRDSIGHHLLAIDLERAINLIQRLKSLHRDARWEVALEQYQALRAMVSAIVAHSPESETELRERLSNARTLFREIEEYVEARVEQGLRTTDITKLNGQLNDVQSDLEDLSSRIGLGN